MSNIKKGDRVVVIAGRDKGKKGEVLKVFPLESRALVSGVNTVKRHQRQTPKQQGGIISKESPIDLSNIAARAVVVFATSWSRSTSGWPSTSRDASPTAASRSTTSAKSRSSAC